MAKQKSITLKADKRLQIPPIAIINNIVFSKKDAWAYFKINTVPYDFLTTQSQIDLANQTLVALSSISQNNGKNLDCHMIITTVPFEPDAWEEQMIEIYNEWNPDKVGRNFYEYIANQTRTLKEANYKKKVTYLGIKLFSRGTLNFDDLNILDFGFKQGYETFKKSISEVFKVVSEEVSKTEEKRAISTESHFMRTLESGTLKVERASSEELLLLTKRILHPAMPAPYLEVEQNDRIGLNDIALETVNAIEQKHKYVKISQVMDENEYTGYRATLSFSRFSDDMGVPSRVPPFMYYPTQRGAPFTMNSRFSIIPTESVKKELEKKKLETKDELNNLAQAGGDGNVHIQSTLEDIDTLENELKDDRLPWVSGSYRLTIEAPTKEMLFSMASSIKQEYAESGTILTWTSGDQVPLMLEEMPGGVLAFNSFQQRTNLALIATSGFNYGGDIGDPIKTRNVTSKRGARNG